MQEKRTIYEILLQENKKQEVADLVSFNEKTESFGLSLSPKEAGELAACRNESLRKWRWNSDRASLSPLSGPSAIPHI